MARSISDIYNSIITEKETFSSLDGLLPSQAQSAAQDNATQLLSQLSSNSRVAIWRLWAYMTAVAIFALEGLFDLFTAEVTTIANNGIPGTAAWFVDRAKKWQYGHDLVVVDFVPQYVTPSPTDQIITQAAAQESGGVLFLKVAKQNNTTQQLEGLSNDELEAFKVYVSKIKFAGTRLSVSSFNADKLLLNTHIYYNGLLDRATVEAAALQSIENYLASLPFDGKVNVQALTDAIQATEGVQDIKWANITAQSSVSTTTVFDLSTGISHRAYTTAAGYIEYDPANSILTFEAV